MKMHWVPGENETVIGVLGHGLEIVVQKIDGGWLVTFANRHSTHIYGSKMVATREALQFARRILEDCLSGVKAEIEDPTDFEPQRGGR